jgi:hypothetical protein
MSWLVSVRGYFTGLFLVSLLLLSSVISVPLASAVSPYDAWINPPANLFLQRGACPTVDITDTWYDFVTGSPTLSQLIKDEIADARINGHLSVSQHIENNFNVIRLNWVTFPVALTWETAGIRVTSGASGALITQDPSICGNIDVANYQSSLTSTNRYIERPATAGIPEIRLYIVYGVFSAENYPAGYEGQLIPYYVAPPPPFSYSSVITDTVGLVNENVPQVVAISLILGSANFILQWFVFSAMSSKLRGQRND